MNTKTFSTKSTKHGWKDLTVTLEFPSDPSETDLIEARYGSLERVFEVAAASAIISNQNGMREQPTKAEARAYAESFCDDGKKRVTTKRVNLTAEADAFTDEQKAIMRQKGIII